MIEYAIMIQTFDGTVIQELYFSRMVDWGANFEYLTLNKPYLRVSNWALIQGEWKLMSGYPSCDKKLSVPNSIERV